MSQFDHYVGLHLQREADSLQLEYIEPSTGTKYTPNVWENCQTHIRHMHVVIFVFLTSVLL